MCLEKVVHGQVSARDHWLHRRGWKVFIGYSHNKVLYSPYQSYIFERYTWKSIPKSHYNKILRTRKLSEYGIGFHFCRYKTDAVYLAEKLNNLVAHWSVKRHIIKPIYFKDPTAYGIEHDVFGHRSLVGVARQIFICDAHSSENKFKAFPYGII